MNSDKTLQDYVRQHGALQKEMADAYILQVETALKQMHQERHVCHGDIRPAMILISSDGKARLDNSSMTQAYTEEGAANDLRDLEAVRQYLLTGKREMDLEQHLDQEQEDSPTGREENTEHSESLITPKKNNTISYLLGAIVAVMVGSLIWYFFSEKYIGGQKQKTTVTQKAFADYIYDGEIVNGLPHGKGVAKYHDGRLYQGQFRHGKRNDNRARFVYADGKVFVGSFVADTIKKGRVDLVTKDYYFVGDFVQGKPYFGYWYRTSDNKKVERVDKGKEILL